MSGLDRVTTREINIAIPEHHCTISINLPISACKELDTPKARALRETGLVRGYQGKMNRSDVYFLFIAKAGDPGNVITSALKNLGFKSFTHMVKMPELSDLLGAEVVTAVPQASLNTAKMRDTSIELPGTNLSFSMIYGEGQRRDFYIYWGQEPSPDLSSLHIVALVECPKSAANDSALDAMHAALKTATVTHGTSLAC